MKTSKHILLFYMLIGISFLLLMFLSPLRLDDYYDYYLWGTTQRLSSISDYIHNLYLHYCHLSARVIPHCFIELFHILPGKHFFNIINTIVFLAFLYLITKYSSNYQPSIESFSLLCLGTSCIFLFMPGFSNVFLWASGACNYLWVAVLSIGFLMLMSKRDGGNPLFLFVLGLICGWTNEALTIGIAIAWLFCFITDKNSITRRRFFLMMGYCIGVLLLIVSPASIHRVLSSIGSSISHSSIIHRTLSSVLSFNNLRFFPIFLILLIVSCLFHKVNRSYFKDNKIEIIAVITSILFVIATNYHSDRSRFGIELFSLILILKLVHPFLQGKTKIISIICCIVLTSILFPTLIYSRINFKETKNCISQIKEPDSFFIETNDIHIPALFDRLVLKITSSEVSFLGDSWIERFYSKDSLCFLPKRFVEKIKQSEGYYLDFEPNTDLPFYAKSVDPNTIVDRVVLHLSLPDIKDIPFFLRPFKDKMERYYATDVMTNRFRVITLPHNGSFLLVGKNKMVADRVVSISYQSHLNQ